MKNVIVLILLLAVLGTVQANLVLNPSFENGTWEDGWSTPNQWWTWGWSPQWIDDAGAARTGDKAIQLFDGGSSYNSAQVGQDITVEPGQVMAFSVWARSDDGGTLSFEARFRDGGEWLDAPSITVIPTSDWAQYNIGTYQAPPLTDDVQIVLLNPNPGGSGGSVFVDDVSAVLAEPKALRPDPGSGATGVPVVYPTATVLTWLSSDPNTTDENVYFGKAADYPDPNLLPLVAALPGFTQTWDPGTLDYNTEYIWQVDLIYDVGGTKFDYIKEGDVWSFTTIDKRPHITSEPNAVFVNGLMTVSAVEYDGASTGNLTYQWYDSSGTLSDDAVISGSTSTTLTFTAADESYIDSYYCIVTDTVETLETTSDSALVDIPRLFAHFTFEPSTINGEYVQNIISGTYDGRTVDSPDPNWWGPIDYADGKVGGQAVVFVDPRAALSEDEQWMDMSSELLNPVLANGGKQITIAMWANPSEAVMQRQALFSAFDSDWLDNLTVFCPTVDGGSTIRFEDQVGAEYVEWTFDANEVTLTDQWHHFVFTKNVDSGDMKIYMDADPKATTNAALADIVPSSIENDLLLGAHIDWDEAFNGSVDDFRMYNYVLSDAEVAQLYACSSLGYDLDFSCNVDLTDFGKLAEEWDGGAGGGYDIDDLAGLCSEWLDDNN
jgi:hypothetical protein